MREGKADLRHAREDGKERAHFGSAESAIEADRERLRVGDADVKRFRGGAGEGPAALVHNRPRDHHRDTRKLPSLKHRLDGKESRLRVECVEDRLDEKEVHSPRQKASHLLRVRCQHLVEIDPAEIRVLHLKGERK